MKTFVSPGSWFAFDYPDSWSEFEETDGFLFYDPVNWTGNFRICAYRDKDRGYGKQCMENELGRVGTELVRIGSCKAVQSIDHFYEEDVSYDSWFWLIGNEQTCVECSFTLSSGMPPDMGLRIVNSLLINPIGTFFYNRLVTLRLMEIAEIDAAYNEVERMAKKICKARFSGIRRDLPILQRLADGEMRKEMVSIGLTLCAMIAEELEGYEWRTLIDGAKEKAVLLSSDGTVTDPQMLFDSRGGHMDIYAAFDKIVRD